ncbi:substrate-binding protein [Ancylobacter defluvii]|uniref:Substrate-binding protein n=1 Tax=Ancylobacter defluvii TaxID=1282440 RepID=A0A9W6NAX0_9HYPH|nr:transporter substrate-binding domain-containing protein [Ancylobacter defluvii]MBS7588626.1 transporter substrate-binding domain-containing protein [Ancylobacter defluvii]GLK83906.1 substrate-binding protein [Ancylobacter defluvii]
MGAGRETIFLPAPGQAGGDTNAAEERVKATVGKCLQHQRLAGWAAALMLLAASAVAGSAAPAPLRIGVAHVPPKADVPAARLYTQDGFDLELAAEIGRRLGRKVELVDIGDQAAEALAAGRIDLAVAPQDGALPSGVELLPSGYQSGLSVAMRTDTDIRSWEGLAGRKVCVVASNDRARRLVRAVGGQEVVQPVPALALMQVRTGECDAAIHDEVVLRRLFGEAEWKKFSATLPARDSTPLVVALPADGTRPGSQAPPAEALRSTLAALADSRFWDRKTGEWATNVALEVYLEQDAPDCH